MKNKKIIVFTILLLILFNFGIFNNFSYADDMIDMYKTWENKDTDQVEMYENWNEKDSNGDKEEVNDPLIDEYKEKNKAPESLTEEVKKRKQQLKDAGVIDESSLVDPTTNPNVYRPDEPDADVINDLAGEFVAILRNISVITSVIFVMILGVRYILGSVEERADYKKTMIPIAIGMGFITLILTIITFLHNTIQHIFQ